MQAFVNVFGEYAGWAHNALFISQLASHKELLEAHPSHENASVSGASSESEITAEARTTVATVLATPSSKSKKQKRAAGSAKQPPAKKERSGMGM